MDREESQHLFHEADERFRANDFQGALDRLESLNAAFPNQRRVMFPMVRSLTRLGRYQEALDLNQKIIDQFDYEPAKQAHPQLQQQLMTSLNQKFDSSGIPKLETGTFNTPTPGDIPGYGQDTIQTPSPTGLPQPDFNINLTPRPAPPPMPRPSASTNWAPWLIAAAIIAIYITLVFATNRNIKYIEFDGQENVVFAEDMPSSAVITANLLLVAISFMAGVPAGYCALLVTDLRKHNDVYEDIKDVALYVVICLALNLLPVIGWIAVIVILASHYETGFLKLIVMGIIYSIVGGAITILLALPTIIPLFARFAQLEQ